MTVYVDCSISVYSKNAVHRLFADDEVELHVAAAKLGVPLKRYDSLNRWYLLGHRERFVAILHGGVRLVGREAEAMIELRRLWGVMPPLDVAKAYAKGVR